VDLYTTFLKLAPLLLLKLLAKRGFVTSARDRERQGRVGLAADVALIVSAVGGGFIAILVLGDVLPATAATRGALVIAGCLSLLLLGEYMLGQVASLYRDRRRGGETPGPSGGTSTWMGETS
jgi:hypothetical protein